ncbi:hypothetical protein K443DRAFT_106741 [Laccaria amethystina LaAM-08-1]|uniref:BTB domain-containing protein n=1 Tax=Laccaria amethystina LaAM-08-1 TaxID=1095629 RepID=A0A0C9XGG2_9AGAR|nr:hypothetical protein K443DRAFT_106741 [Laccaria amethystina LaAM-08-1]
MVHLLFFNPLHKLGFLGRLFFRGSKRLLKPADAGKCTPPASKSRVPNTPLYDNEIRAKISGEVFRDPDYYKDDSEGGFCVFRVENTLFKVHRCFLLREPSAFVDMFSLPQLDEVEGGSDKNSIVLTDTAEQFRDFLWVLYALPIELINVESPTAPSLQRLINIATVANKYCFASYESWALDRIFMLAQDPVGFLRNDSPEICSMVLNLAVICDHQGLIDLVTQRLIARILWSSIDHDSILDVARTHGLRKLEGVVYYKQLINLEQASSDGRMTSQPVFSTSMNVEKRMGFLAAHHSLVNLWGHLRTTPPLFHAGGCPSHSSCITAWGQAWTKAGGASQTMRCGSADVLGRLKSMMVILRKNLTETQSMSIPCTLAALEAITITRDDIVSDLMEHFCEY